MGDIADEICPGNSVRGAHEPGMGDWAKRLANVGCVGDVPMGGEEESAEAVCVSSVAVGCVG
jgi:hypothetical protein